MNLHGHLPAGLAGLMALLGLVHAASAAVAPDSFPLQRTLHPPPGPRADVARFYLDAAVFAGAAPDFADVRLFDDRDAETPFLIRRRIPVRSVTRRIAFPAPAEITAFREVPTNRVEITVIRPRNAPLASELRFESSLKNFEKLVTVHGKRDEAAGWELLAAEEPLYDYTRFIDVRRDHVAVKAGPYTLYRIEMANIVEAKDSPLVQLVRQTRGGDSATETTSFRREPFRLDRIVFIESREETAAVPDEPETAEFTVPPLSISEDARRRQTLVTFSSGNRPVTAVTLMTEDENFSRHAVLEGKGPGGEGSWRPLANGRLTRVKAGRIRQDLLTLTLPETRQATLRLVIDNQDNPPVTVSGLRLTETRYEALFFPKPDRAYRFAQGALGLTPPRYDVAAVLTPVPSETAGLWELSDIGFMPPVTVARRFLPGGRTVLVAVLALMAAALAAIVIRLARQVDASQS